MSESVHTGPTDLPDPENVDVAFWISLWSSTEAEILRYFLRTVPEIAAIFDLPLTP